MGINWKRKLFHLSSALFFLALTKVLPENQFRFILLIILMVTLLFEGFRLWKPQALPLRSFWEPLLREREKRGVSDALWFVLGLFGASIIAPYNYLQPLILILGISDPLAELTGRKWGRIRLARGKTLEGALGFALSAFLITLLSYPNATLNTLFFLVIPLTFVELLTRKDNLWIPLVGGIILNLYLKK